MALCLLKHKKSILNTLHKVYLAPTWAVPLNMPAEDQNVSQPKAAEDHNNLQHHWATCEVMKWLVEAIRVTETPWPI